MRRLVVLRLLQLLAVAALISILVFLLVHLLPGNPTATILGPDATPRTRGELLHQLGLGRPLVAQYLTWLGNVLQGNLGRSFLTGQSVTGAIAVAFPIDVELIAASQVIALALAVPLALAAARRPNRLLDRIATTSSFGLLSLPTFVVSVLLVLVLATEIHALPATGFVRISAGFGANIRSIVLPSVSLALGSIPIYYRLLRTNVVTTLQQEYITAARAKGLSDRYVLWRHALRPSSFSLLAGAGLSIGSLFTGAFVVEYFFALPGIGFQLVNAIYSRDYLMVQGMALVAATAFVVVNACIDFLLVALDPRIRRT